MSDEESRTTDEADVAKETHAADVAGESIVEDGADRPGKPDETDETDGTDEASVSIDRRTALKAGALATVTSIGASGFLLTGDADSTDDIQYGYGGTPVQTSEEPTESTATSRGAPTGATTVTTTGATEIRNLTTVRGDTGTGGRVDESSNTSGSGTSTTTEGTETATTASATTTTTELDPETYGVQGYGEYGYGGVASDP